MKIFLQNISDGTHYYLLLKIAIFCNSSQGNTKPGSSVSGWWPVGPCNILGWLPLKSAMKVALLFAFPIGGTVSFGLFFGCK
jgi:hypothetical protein